MKRTNYTNDGGVVQFGNGNINIKFSKSAIEAISRGKYSDIEVISWLLDGVDTDFIGEEFCLSDYDMGAMLYNFYADKVYIISFTDIQQILLKGKTLRLYAKGPDKYDREVIRKERSDGL